MNKITAPAAILLPLILILGCSSGQDTDDVTAAIAETLKERFPNVQIKEVVPSSDVQGFYEVVTATEIVYTDASGDLLISGVVLDTRTKRNLTERRWGLVNAIDFEALPFDLAIKTVKGDGSRRLAVFSDPDCPYCKGLEREMEGLDNVTVYTFLYPLEDIHPSARQKAARIWCSEERATAWSEWMLNDVLPQETKCDNDPVDRVLEAAAKLKVGPAPTLFFADGRRVEGKMPRDQIEQELKSLASEL